MYGFTQLSGISYDIVVSQIYVLSVTFISCFFSQPRELMHMCMNFLHQHQTEHLTNKLETIHDVLKQITDAVESATNTGRSRQFQKA